MLSIVPSPVMKKNSESSLRRVRPMFLSAMLFGAMSISVEATIVRFTTVMGNFDVRLYDEATPASVANFLSYVNSGQYDDVVIHRSVPGFVVQGGRYKSDGVARVDPAELPQVTQGPTVINEPGISNLRGTLAFAKLGGLPNSASREWFFNLANNAANLDVQNGGFTVFGRVLDQGIGVMDSIATLPRFQFDLGAWAEAPMRNYSFMDFNTYAPVGPNQLVRMSVTVLDVKPGDYNRDGVVDLEDIKIWHETLGSKTRAEADGNGDGVVDQADFEIWKANQDQPPTGAQPIQFKSTEMLENGAFRFTFENTPGLALSVVVTDDLTAPLSEWEPLGLVKEDSPGKYSFTDASAVGMGKSFYRVSQP